MHSRAKTVAIEGIYNARTNQSAGILLGSAWSFMFSGFARDREMLRLWNPSLFT